MAIGLSFACVPVARCASPARTSPNVVLIVADDLDSNLETLDHVPEIRRLIAGDGVEFSNFFVNISLCCPSRLSLLRGQYVHNHRVFTNKLPDGGFEHAYALGIEQQTLATALQKAGYETTLLGKYLNNYPNSATKTYIPPGWTHWAVPVNGDEYTEYTEFNYDLNEDGRIVHYRHAVHDYMVDVISKKAVALIQASRSPFFMYLAPYAPHLPATPAPRYRHVFNKLRAPRLPSWNESDVSDKPKIIAVLPQLSAVVVHKIDRLYRQRVRSLLAVADLVRNVKAALQEKGVLDNTYIIFTSDNGFHLGEHRVPKGKYLAYEEDIHVPLYMRGPGLPSGQKRSELTSMIDLAPTIAELTGSILEVPPDGRSLVGLLNSPVAVSTWRNAVLIEQYPLHPKTPRLVVNSAPEPFDPVPPLDIYPRAFYYGLRTANYKYVEYGQVTEGGDRELYNLNNDPFELKNLARISRGDVFKPFHQSLRKLRECAGDSCRQADRIPQDILEGLKW